MECPICESQNAISEFRSYTLDEFAVENIVLHNVEFTVCPDCEEETFTIPRYNLVIKQIRELLCSINKRLSAGDFAFLRTQLGVNGQDYAKLVGVSNVTVSRWESGDYEISKSADRAIRHHTLSAMGMKWERINRVLMSIEETDDQLIEVDLNNFGNNCYSYEVCLPLEKRDNQSLWLVVNGQ